MSNRLTRWAYTASQGARVAWFAGHYIALNRLRGPLTAPGEAPLSVSAPIPDRAVLLREIRSLFARDWKHIEQGWYRAPPIVPPPLPGILQASRDFFADARNVDARRLDRRATEVREQARRASYPAYYLQNFHYQSDGWLSEESARRYETQVEVLFGGTAAVMRRQALAPIGRHLKGTDQRRVRLLDLATGTGPFLREVAYNWPRMAMVGVDLSSCYLIEARRRLPRGNVSWVEAQAERLPMADAQFDLVSSIYLQHELPPKIRRRVFAEVARVLKPGGRFILLDALQTGDRESLDALLEIFPVGFHEPYFSSYLTENFADIGAAAGLDLETAETAFLSKVMTFRKRL